ncbi:MAG: metallophosphoesterase, partial [Gammaproteobacteria bacterium]|nr:metallophosphoesterase [Gammaproteobacteria bacterium]
MNPKRFLSAVVALFLAAGVHAEILTILHTNDLHSRVEPINKYDSNCSAKDDAAGKCFGGYARLATAIRTARADAPNALLVDAGDQFQGSLFYTRYKGKVAAEMMNTLGYDAMTVGNHEFDDGPEVLRGFMDAVRFPVLMSNADVTSEPALADVMMPSTIIRRGGYRYGLIGLTPVDTPEISLPGPKIRFTEPAGAVRREIERFAGQGID